MSRRGAFAFLTLALLELASSSATAGQAAPAPPEWWGPTQIGEGFHFRIPVTVNNSFNYTLPNAPVALEIDLAQKLIEAGWISAPSGDRDLLQSFEFDESSIRVIPMTDLDPPSPGSTHGRIRANDPRRPVDDPLRYTVPSTFYRGSLFGDAAPYDAKLNPFITVLWRVPDALAPGERRYYMVYFDSTTTKEQGEADYGGSVGGGDLDSLYWSGAGRVLYGHVNPPRSQAGSVLVLGLHVNTTVEAYKTTTGGGWSFVPHPENRTTGKLRINASEAKEFVLGTGSPVSFKLVADRPILAMGTSAGFVPSIDGGMTGKDFLFAHRHPLWWEQDTIYFTSTTDEPTEIDVTSLTTGTTYKYYLNDRDNQQNPYPYTIGPRGEETNGPSGSNPCRPVKPLLPSAPDVYRARVVKGDRVLLQLQPSDGLSQAPTRFGSPAGSDFYAATGWTDKAHEADPPAACPNFNRGGTWFAAATDEDSAVRVTSIEKTLQVDPPQAPNNPAPPPRPVGQAPDKAAGPHPAGFLDRPLRFEATSGPVQLFVGNSPPQEDVREVTPQGVIRFPNARPLFGTGLVPVVNGPLGGAQTARLFSGFGPAVIFAPYADTRVRARLDFAAGGVSERELNLPKDGYATLQDASSFDRLEAFRLESNLPIIVYPTLGTAGILAGEPTFLNATTGPADFRSFLIELSSTTGVEPLSASAIPGETVTQNLRLTNLGRKYDGSLVDDTVHLSISQVPGWTATLDRKTVPLQGGESVEVQVSLRADSNLTAGGLGVFTIRATSQGNPRMSDAVDAVTFLKRSFDVGIWFGQVGGPKIQTLAQPPGTDAEFAVVVQNKGSVSDRIALELSPPDKGWLTLMMRNGVETSEIQLDPRATAEFKLRVKAPAGLAEGIAITTVTAKSLSEPAALDRVTATTKLSAPSDIVLEAPEPTRLARPGEEVAFPLTLKNKGIGSAEVEFQLQVGAPSGWGTARIFVQPALGGDRIQVERISLGPGDVLPLRVTITPPAWAPAGTAATLRLSAGVTSSTAQQEAFLLALVRPVHALAVTMPPQPIEFQQGPTERTLDLRVQNQGNLDETLVLDVAALPLGWSLDLPSDLAILRNATQALPVRLRPDPNAAVGEYQVAFDFVSHDGNRTRVPIQVVVGIRANPRIVFESNLTAQPGTAALVPLRLVNEGNTPFIIRLQAASDESWPLAEGFMPLLVEPDGRVVIQTGWRVPTGAADGTTLHRFRLQFEPQHPNAVPSTKDFEILVDVARTDVSLVSAHSFRGVAGTIVQAVVANTGVRDAQNFTVELRLGVDVLDRITVGLLPAGDQVELSFLSTSPGRGPMTVVVDAGNLVVETDESNNGGEVSAPGSGRKSPAGGFLAVVVALGLTILTDGVRRRRAE